MILEVQDLVAGYGEIDILQGVSLTVQQGEITCIIGPNGAGKSTLFKAIFGTILVKKGSIRFAGQDITHKNPLDILKLGLSYVPQGRCNFPAMSVRENLEMGAFSRNDDQIEADITEIFHRFPMLEAKKHLMAGNLSGGEQQILEMARALLLHPKLIMLDEPSLGLAPKMSQLVFEKIKEINASGTAILIVEQNAKRALSISDHAVVLELGKKRFEGTGEEIMHNPQVKQLYLGG
jgi:branched-chain amino acid transport system ATP-binding protein